MTEDVGKGKVGFPIISRFFLHVENSSHHFKITGDIKFVPHLFKELKMEDPTASIVITFGCTGHGKGTWVSLQ